MSLTYTEHQMLAEIVMQLKRIADALDKSKQYKYLTVDEMKKPGLIGKEEQND